MNYGYLEDNMTTLTRTVVTEFSKTIETFTPDHLTQQGHYRVGSKAVEEYWMNPETREIVTYKVVHPENQGYCIGDHVVEGIPDDDTDVGVIVGFDLPNRVAIVKYEWWHYGKETHYTPICLDDLVKIQ